MPSDKGEELSSIIAKSQFLSIEQLKEAIAGDVVSLKGSLWSICIYKSVPGKVGGKRARGPPLLGVFPGKQALTISVGILTADPGSDMHDWYQCGQDSVSYSLFYTYICIDT